MLGNLIYALRQKRWINIFIIYTRYLIGGAYILACMPKIWSLRFTQPNLEGQVFEFFEALYNSGLYWNFIGWGQLIAATLLMTQRFSTLGAIIFLPISLNIFFITLSMDFGGTPVITGLMLLANIMLLLWDYHKLEIFLKGNRFEPVHAAAIHPISDEKQWTILGIILCLFTICSYNLSLNPFFWFIISVSIGLGGFIFYFAKNRKSKKISGVIAEKPV